MTIADEDDTMPCGAIFFNDGFFLYDIHKLYYPIVLCLSFGAVGFAANSCDEFRDPARKISRSDSAVRTILPNELHDRLMKFHPLQKCINLIDRQLPKKEDAPNE